MSLKDLKKSMKHNSTGFLRFWKHLGPGLILAGTCIGVSHLVQSTRAGAAYGFGLLWAVILANVFKFPFFEFAPRYVAATGENLLRGYKKLGNWAFWLFMILTGITMFPIVAALTLVTTGLFVNLTHWAFPPITMSIMILLSCMAILIMGKYPVLELLMKVMIVLLGLSTIGAIVLAVMKGYAPDPQFAQPFVWDLAGVSFLVALMGWMPSTIDISVWHSFWSMEHHKMKGNTKEGLKTVLLDFHFGYWGTMVMAVFFLSLGAFVMYGSGEGFSDSAVGFTSQIIGLYTNALGQWSFPVIATAAAITMFSTTLSCLDAYPRVVREAALILKPGWEVHREKLYSGWMIVCALVALVIINIYVAHIKILIDLTTTASFLAAPIFAYINLKTLTGPYMPNYAVPSKQLVWFSWLGIFFLTVFGLVFFYWTVFVS